LRSIIFQALLLFGMLWPVSLPAAEGLSPEHPKKASLLNPAIFTIRTWQLFSKNSHLHLVNCQFRPSCSEYGLAAIQEAGTVRGILYSADRIARCHPGARRYYPRDVEGKLLDDFRPGPQFQSRTAPQVFIPLSLLLPGLNKMVNGRFYDGLTTLFITDAAFYSLYEAQRRGSWLRIPCALAFSIFYASDIYCNGMSIGGK
jgi:putative component of membrane protein insertase Oxa1/YidC/SpoIIIJ protein YidD